MVRTRALDNCNLAYKRPRNTAVVLLEESVNLFGLGGRGGGSSSLPSRVLDTISNCCSVFRGRTPEALFSRPWDPTQLTKLLNLKSKTIEIKEKSTKKKKKKEKKDMRHN